MPFRRGRRASMIRLSCRSRGCPDGRAERSCGPRGAVERRTGIQAGEPTNETRLTCLDMRRPRWRCGWRRDTPRKSFHKQGAQTVTRAVRRAVPIRSWCGHRLRAGVDREAGPGAPDRRAHRRLGIPAERIYLDTKSGATADRPGLRAVLEYARTGDVIVVHALDRLGRTMAMARRRPAHCESALPLLSADSPAPAQGTRFSRPVTRRS